MSGGDVLTVSSPIVMWANLLLFNGAIIRLLQIILSRIDLNSALQEKLPPQPPNTDGNTSYSRLTGMIGLVVIACFFWALANVILFKAFVALDDIQKLLTGISSFVLAGASLFAPYAFNQLAKAFKVG